MADSFVSTTSQVKQRVIGTGSGTVSLVTSNVIATTTIAHNYKKTPFMTALWSLDNATFQPLGDYNNAGGAISNTEGHVYADRNNIYLVLYNFGANVTTTGYFRFIAYQIEVI